MTRAVAHEPNRAVSSARECNWCEVSREYCPKRIKSGVH